MKLNLRAPQVFFVGLLFLLYARSALAFSIFFPPGTLLPPQDWLPPQDYTPPSLSIALPRGAAALKKPEVTIAGAASDDQSGVAGVSFQVQNCYSTNDFQSASGTASWSAQVTGLVGGTNIITVLALDGAGNSTEQQVTVFYVQKSLLDVAIESGGKVTPNMNGRSLEVGKYYSMTAQPENGFAFAGWEGDGIAAGATVTFLMESNLVLQADFVPTPFSQIAGDYQGTITPTVAGASESVGTIKAKISQKGTFVAKVQLEGVNYSLTGVFLADGSYSGLIQRKKLPNAPVKLQLQLDINNRTVSGTVTDTSLSSDPTGTLTATYLRP